MGKRDNNKNDPAPALINTGMYYEQLLDNIKDGFITLDKEFRYTFLNKNASLLLELDPGKVTGKHVWEVFPDARETKVYEAICEAFNKQVFTSCTEYYQPLALWFETEVYPSPSGVALFVKDISARKKAEERTSDSQAKLRSIIRHTGDIIVLSDKDGIVTYISPSIERICGYTPEEMVGRKAASILHKDCAVESEQVLKRLQSEPGVPIQRLCRARHKNGHYLWLEGTVTNLLNDPGVGALVSNYHDITERKEAELTLRESEMLYRGLFENLLHGASYCKAIFENGKTVDFLYVSTNKAHAKVTGQSGLEGKTAREVFPNLEIHLPGYLEKITRVCQTGTPESYETYIAHMNKWFCISLFCPKPGYFVSMVDDITEKKKFTSQQMLLASIVNSSDDAIISKNLDGKITSWNRGAEKLLGFSAEEAVGKNIIEFIPADRIDEEKMIIERIKNGEHVEHFETERIKKNGKLVSVSLTVSPIKDNAGRITGASKVARDITEKKKLMEQQALLASIVSSSQDAIFSRDNTGCITSWNNSAKKLFGYSSREAIGMHIKQLIPSSRASEWDEVFSKIERDERINHFETERLTKSGDSVYISLTISPIKSAKGELTGASVIARNITEKRLAEEKIKQSEINLATIIENSTEAFVLIDTDLRIKAFNQRARENVLLQFGEAPIREGSMFLEHIYEERRALVREALIRALSGEHIQYESDFYEKDGEPFWFNGHFIPVKENQAITGVCIAVKDITKRKKSDEKLRRFAENLNAIVENSVQGFILLDRNGIVKLMNHNAIRFGLLAHDKKIMVGFPMFDFVEPERVAYLKSVFASVLEGETINYSRCYSPNNRQPLWLDFSISPVYTDKGVISGICITGIEITEKKLAEQEREFERNNLESLINNTSDLMWSVDRDFNLITCNKPFSRLIKAMVGVEPEKGSNLMFAEFEDESLGRYRKFYERAFAGESFSEIEFVDVSGPSWSEISFYPIRSSGRVIGTACFARDITESLRNARERESLIKELSQNNQDLQQFAYITSHNLRGPVANLLGLSNLLGNYRFEDETLNRLLAGVKKAAQHFDETIRDLAGILTIRDNRSVLIEKLSFYNCFKHVLAQHESLLENCGATLNIDFSAAPEVSFNKSYLESILVNLLSNAIKYRDHMRLLDITVKSENRENETVLIFADNGVGFDAEAQKQKVFKLYQRFHSDREGKGLGLFLIKSQLEALNGFIELESQVNKGTKFIIHFKK